jgi:hypothetical protein
VEVYFSAPIDSGYPYLFHRAEYIMWWLVLCEYRMGLAVIEHDISRKLDWMPRADYIASSVTGFNSNGFFPMGTS